MFHLCYRFCLAQDCATNTAHFHGSGAFALTPKILLRVAMTTEQAHQRLGIAEGVIHELQEQVQRVSAGHQAAHEALQSIHQETRNLSSQIDTRSRVRLVEPKSLMPDRFGKRNGSGWSRRSTYNAETGDEERRKTGNCRSPRQVFNMTLE